MLHIKGVVYCVRTADTFQAGWAHGGFEQIFVLRGFFSFNAVASLDYITLQAGIVRPGGASRLTC